MTGQADFPKCAAIFGASGGIGAALTLALADRGVERIYAGSRSGHVPGGASVIPFTFDLVEESSIAAAAGMMANAPPDLVIVATGTLTLADGTGPERTYRMLDPAAMLQVLRANTIGPAIIAKHLLPLFARDRRSVFAALSARVGSIGDNRMGGWHSYRASKAALNMLLKNFAIELARTHKLAVIAGLHPGTVDTALSQPFQGNVPDKQLFTPQRSAESLLGVLERLQPEDSGGVFDWAGARVPD
ncbi:SDR family NAD(P)-dependent oxidoreductase [Allopontixanthobacter sp.]|uniref:SDR family NAD(P)-dependent oxidoreductase n=1 Tax=Allopontixanthobacter sp. TaxID=2906452 RepID=UPI002ABA8C78|nr:SDR family NAD(P)-dependent oxidoreductase [Allopontixanthobacter sp.]MDZ4308048.1 SDR family NAD(P)-dependent oxidoreductase [Allopontixanthobacter sp.]